MTVSRAQLNSVVRHLGSTLVGRPAHTPLTRRDGDDAKVLELLMQGFEEDVIPVLKRVEESDDDDESVGESIGLAAVRLNSKLRAAMTHRFDLGLSASGASRATQVEAAADALASQGAGADDVEYAREIVEAAWRLAERSFIAARGVLSHPLHPAEDHRFMSAYREFSHYGLLFEWAMFAAGALVGTGSDADSGNLASARGQLPFLWSFAQAAADGMYAGSRAMVTVFERSLEGPDAGRVGEVTDPDAQVLLHASEAELRFMVAEGLA